MSALHGITALVLAGTRPGGDPLAIQAGVRHKGLLDIAGQPMVARVLKALADAPEVARILVATDQHDLLAGIAVGKPVRCVPAAAGPSASVAAVLDAEAAPLLVTTADHALLRAEWISEFLAAAGRVAGDAHVALARRESVLLAAPGSQRTWLRFADGAYSGCNIFLLATPRAIGVVRFWQEMEALRKKPLSMLGRLGFSYVLRYRFGLLSLPQALARLGELAGARLLPVVLQDGRAAIDVDKSADLELVRALLQVR